MKNRTLKGHMPIDAPSDIEAGKVCLERWGNVLKISYVHEMTWEEIDGKWRLIDKI